MSEVISRLVEVGTDTFSIEKEITKYGRMTGRHYVLHVINLDEEYYASASIAVTKDQLRQLRDDLTAFLEDSDG